MNKRERVQRIVLACSGGAHTTAAIPWLAEKHGAEVVALTLDIGQGGDLEAARDRALAVGAIRAHVLDVRDEFARHFVAPALKAGALYDDRRSRALALSRPLIAQKLVEIANIEQTSAVAHGSAAGDPQIGVALRALGPALEIVTVEPDVPLPATAGRMPARAAVASRTPGECPDEAALVDITFSRGATTAINGIAMPLVDLIGSLDIIARAHGVGRSDRLETPAAILLHTAHQDLQAIAITGEAGDFSRRVSQQYAGLIEQGSWFTPLRASLDADVDQMQDRVSGVVRLRLFKGDCTIVERRTAPPADAGAAARPRTLTFTATAKA